MAGGPKERVLHPECGYTLEDNRGGIGWKGEIKE